MEENGWRLLAVTSPTPGCGKTFTALNLAMSMARQPDSSVLLVDGDLHKPQISHRLGFSRDTGLRALLEGKASLQEAITHVAVGGFHLGVLSCERPTSRASDWAGSPQMEQVLRSVRADRDFKVVILDLPPLLAGDETISILPHVDCVLMIAAAGSTKTSDLKDCAQYVKTTPVVRVVFNRAPGASLEYY
jgi:Mrp family chromosome partitioning ATPase